MSDRVAALVHYYAREGFSRQVVTVCSEFLKKRPNDTSLVFYRAALGLLQEGSTSEVRPDNCMFIRENCRRDGCRVHIL